MRQHFVCHTAEDNRGQAAAPMTLGNRAIGAPINIWNDHSDAMSMCDAGWMQLFAETNQEACDLHIQAFRLAEELSMPVMHLCKEMLFTAQPLPVERLVNQGIVSYALPRNQLESKVQSVAENIAKNSPLVVSLLKEELRLLSSAHNLSPETFERVQSMRREVYDSDDYREGISSFVEKRVPQFRGH